MKRCYCNQHNMRWVKNDVDEIVCDLQSTSKKAPIV